MTDIYLGTVAIEPNRWALLDASRSPTIRVSEWLDEIESAGFDGVELWEPHLAEASGAEARCVLEHRLPVAVYNSYVSFDEAEPRPRSEVVDWVRRSGAAGVKYNTGAEAGSVEAYGERLAEFAGALPQSVRLLNECHRRINIAEDPAVAARIFRAAGDGANLQAICHLNEDPDYLRAVFDQLGGRLTHIHVNFLDAGWPRLSEIEERVGAQVDLVRSLGFVGSWTIEFVEGISTDRDEPRYLIENAAADLRVLRELLDA